MFIFLASCSQKGTSKSDFSINLRSFLTSADLTGGVLLRIVDSTNSEAHDYQMSYPFNADIPFGTWNFYFVGFDSNHVKYCGSLLSTEVSSQEESFTVNISTSNCGVEPYLSLENSIYGKWNEGLWGQVKWGN